MKFLVISLSLLCLFSHNDSSARPEYSSRIRTNRCTTCHASPTGGGHRNLTGKAFGPKSAPLKSFSQQDLFGVDVRTLAYTGFTEVKKSKNGLGVMTAIPSVSIPFSGNDEGKEWRLVYSHNLGGFSSGTRDAYLRVKLYDDYRVYPQFISVGQFSSPFGLLTDEHRTYVRWQTKTTWNDYEMGFLVSGDWSPALHYDLAVVSGEPGPPFGFKAGRIMDWGSILNLRYMATSLGWMVGASASAHNIVECVSGESTTGADPATSAKQCVGAVSLYQNLSLDGLTHNWVPGALLAEVVLGYNTNSRLQATQFVSNEEYLNLVLQDKLSAGARAQWNYNLLPDLSFITRYDYLTLDIDYWGDAYHRLSFGLKHFFNNQVSLEARFEKALVTSKNEDKKSGKASQDVAWALLQIKI